MNFLELCQAYRAELGIPGDGPVTVANQIGEMSRVVLDIQAADESIKLAWQDWKFSWREFGTITVVGSDTPALAKPVDVGTWDTNSVWANKKTDYAVQLTYVPYKEWKNTRAVGAQYEGEVFEFTIMPDNSIRVFPLAEEAATIDASYWKRAVRLVNDAEISDIPVEFHRIIIVRAKLIYAEREDAPEIMAGASAEYDDLLSGLEAAYLDNQGDGRQASVIRPRAVRAE